MQSAANVITREKPMLSQKKIAVVIPAFNEENLISKVITGIPGFVDKIVVVNDGSTDNTVEKVVNLKKDQIFANRLELIDLSKNQGVGGAIATGYKWARDNNIEVTAVMAGDGQMNPAELERILMPVINGQADYSKGNRLLTEHSWQNIPKIRFVGNAVLSFMTKAASGYWSVLDSQTGYTAISLRALKTINLDQIYKRYGVPNDILVKLNIYDFRIAQVPIEPIYNVGEQSKLKPIKVVIPISRLLTRLFFHRIFYKYAVRDFHPIFLFYMTGLLFFLTGLAGGVTTLILGILNRTKVLVPEVNISLGWILFFTIFFLSGMNLLLFAIWMDRDENKNLQLNVFPPGF